MRSLIVLSVLVSGTAFATQPHHNSGDQEQAQLQGQLQLQGQAQGQVQSTTVKTNTSAVGVGLGVGQGGEGGDAVAFGGKGGDAGAVSGSSSDARSSSISQGGKSDSSAVGIGEGGQSLSSASNGGNSLSTSYSSNDEFTSLALGLGSVSAAPIDSSVCRNEQTAGWRVALVERTGRNKFDEACMEQLRKEQLAQAAFNRCMDLANAYLRVRLESAYVLQLEKCGGVLERALISSSLSARPVEQLGTPEYATREELRRAFEAAQSK